MAAVKVRSTFRCVSESDSVMCAAASRRSKIMVSKVIFRAASRLSTRVTASESDRQMKANNLAICCSV